MTAKTTATDTLPDGTYKVRIKPGSKVFQDSAGSTWPKLPRKTLTKHHVDMEFDGEWNAVRASWHCSAPGFGKKREYGNGDIIVSGLESVEIISAGSVADITSDAPANTGSVELQIGDTVKVMDHCEAEGTDFSGRIGEVERFDCDGMIGSVEVRFPCGEGLVTTPEELTFIAHAAPPSEPAQDQRNLQTALQQMRAAFHVNMLRAFPHKTHAEIASEIDRACDLVGAVQQQHHDNVPAQLTEPVGCRNVSPATPTTVDDEKACVEWAERYYRNDDWFESTEMSVALNAWLHACAYARSTQSRAQATRVAIETIDTPEFRKLVAHVQGWDDGEPMLDLHSEALIAHIAAKIADAREEVACHQQRYIDQLTARLAGIDLMLDLAIRERNALLAASNAPDSGSGHSRR